MAELDKKLKITARFAQCFRDYRDSSYVDYSVHQLLAQRVYGIVLGYEELNDHDQLRYDPALAIAPQNGKTRGLYQEVLSQRRDGESAQNLGDEAVILLIISLHFFQVAKNSSDRD